MRSSLTFLQSVYEQWLIVVVVGFLLVFSGGCTADPLSKAYTTRVFFNQTIGTINTARANHLIGDTAFDSINDSEHNLSGLLDELDIAAIKAEANKTSISAQFDFNKVFDAVRAELNTLATKWSAAKAATSNAKPSTPSARLYFLPEKAAA